MLGSGQSSPICPSSPESVRDPGNNLQRRSRSQDVQIVGELWATGVPDLAMVGPKPTWPVSAKPTADLVVRFRHVKIYKWKPCKLNSELCEADSGPTLGRHYHRPFAPSYHPSSKAEHASPRLSPPCPPHAPHALKSSLESACKYTASKRRRTSASARARAWSGECRPICPKDQAEAAFKWSSGSLMSASSRLHVRGWECPWGRPALGRVRAPQPLRVPNNHHWGGRQDTSRTERGHDHTNTTSSSSESPAKRRPTEWFLLTLHQNEVDLVHNNGQIG